MFLVLINENEAWKKNKIKINKSWIIKKKLKRHKLIKILKVVNK